MIIQINQSELSLTSKYTILVNSEIKYYAGNKILDPMNFELYTANNERGLTIHKNWSLFSARYDIITGDGTTSFRTKSFWRGSYQCNYASDSYEIYANMGRKYSVFNNGTQVAWWTKKAVSFFGGDRYTITADNDCDEKMVIAFCLIIDNYYSNDSNTVDIDLGTIAFPAKKFDESWKPKE